LFRYGLEQGDAASDFSSRFTEITHGNFYFNYRGRYQGVEILENQMYCGLPGYHNIENATAALGVTCNILNLDAASLRQGLSDFRGVKRRFEYLIKQHDAVVIDDYAHHPEELRAILSSVRALYPDKKLTAIFQPHLFTRTRDFASGFAEVLAMPDELILMDIYPARELPIPGISSQWLLEQIAHDHKSLLSPQAITTKVKSEKPELLLLLGAGDIDRLSNPIKQIYEAD
jgi:UDP-N-acetylmuramate--alanine ligase